MVDPGSTTVSRIARPAPTRLDRTAAVIAALIAGPMLVLLVGHFYRASSFSSDTEVLLAGVVLLGIFALSFRSGSRR